MYKIFGIEEIGVLNNGRFAGNGQTIRKSNDGSQFVTQLRTGIAPEEGEVFLSHPETVELMSTELWKSQEI